MSQGFIHSGFNAKVAGDVIQVQRYETGATATGTTVIPFDDTIPQNTEGDQYMSVSITPTNVNSILRIDVVWVGSGAATDILGVALFQDSTAGALAATGHHVGAGQIITIPLTHYMTAGTVASTTFKVRAGSHNAGTTTFNGYSGRIYGGVMASSITVTEIASGTLIREAGSNIAGNIAVAKAWCKFNGTGTPAMAGTPYNMSNTITDNGTGDYTLTFTTPFADANYSVVGMTVTGNFVQISAMTASTVRVLIYDYNGAPTDASIITLIAFGNQ